MNDFSILIHIVQELEKLIDIMKLAHELLNKDLVIDSFDLMMNEMQENISLVSFSSRLAIQVGIYFLMKEMICIGKWLWSTMQLMGYYYDQFWTEMQNDFLPNFILCNTTQRFVRSSKVSSVPVQKPTIPQAKPSFYCGTPVSSQNEH